jgi:hypothetical protein
VITSPVSTTVIPYSETEKPRRCASSRRHDAEVEAEAVVRDDGRLGRALGDHLGDPGQLREVLRQRLRVAGSGDDVEVAHGLLAAARAARLADAVGGRMLAQHLDHGEQRRQRLAEQRPRRAGRLLLARGRLEDALLRLRAEARQGAQPLRARGVLELGERRHAELLPDLANRLRAEAGDVEELDHLGRDRLAPLRERLDLAGVHDLDDLVLDRGADSRQLLGRSVQRELRHGRARLAHSSRRTAVGEHPERGLAFDLQQVGQQLELLGHVRVAGERLRHDKRS